MEKHEDVTSILSMINLDNIEKTISQPYHETGPGRPPRKPLGIFKAYMIKQLRHIPSDRELYRRLWNDEALRIICDIEEKEKPYHPSQLTRFRNKVGPERLEGIMNSLIRELVEGEIIKGETLALDATFIKAWSRRDPADDSHGYSDPESRVGRDGKTYDLGYKLHLAVDVDSDMPVAAVVASANENEKKHTEELLEKASRVVEGFRVVVADSQYSSRRVRDCVLGYGAGGNPILMDMTKRRREEDFPAEVIILVRIHDIELHARKKNRDFSALEKLGYKGLQTLSKLGLFREKPPSPEDLRLKTVDRFESDIDEFWDRIKDGYQFALKRDSQFLNWRFCDQRNGSHRITIAYIKEEIAGYCVTRINKYIPDYPEGYIVDLMTLSGRSDVAELLLSDATNYFDENQINIGYYMGIKNRPETRILNTLGYIDSRSGFGVGLHAINPYYVDVVEKLKTVDPSKIDYQFAHTDWI